jgi:hypothetical protein
MTVHRVTVLFDAVISDESDGSVEAVVDQVLTLLLQSFDTLGCAVDIPGRVIACNPLRLLSWRFWVECCQSTVSDRPHKS